MHKDLSFILLQCLNNFSVKWGECVQNTTKGNFPYWESIRKILTNVKNNYQIIED